MSDKFYRILRATLVVLGIVSVLTLTAVTVVLYQNCSIITFLSRCG